MLRIFILIVFFLLLNVNMSAFPHFDMEDFLSLDREMYGVKSITERRIPRNQFRESVAKTVSHFDKEGFLLRTSHTGWRRSGWNRIRLASFNTFEHHFVSDALLEIKQTRHRYINNTLEERGESFFRFHYDSLDNLYRFERYSFLRGEKELWSVAKNFIYKEGQLQSYETHFQDAVFFHKTVFTYAENQRTRQILVVYEDNDSITLGIGKSIFIYENGKLTDFIRVAAEGELIVSGEPNWNSETGKVHIRYSNFDRRGNWRRSHFITERGRVLRSRRSIEYW